LTLLEKAIHDTRADFSSLLATKEKEETGDSLNPPSK